MCPGLLVELPVITVVQWLVLIAAHSPKVSSQEGSPTFGFPKATTLACMYRMLNLCVQRMKGNTPLKQSLGM